MLHVHACTHTHTHAHTVSLYVFIYICVCYIYVLHILRSTDYGRNFTIQSDKLPSGAVLGSSVYRFDKNVSLNSVFTHLRESSVYGILMY